MKELDSSFHIIRHFRHNDKPSRCLNVKRTSERMISLQQNVMTNLSGEEVFLPTIVAKK